ncbi:hypothetical protein MMC10_009686 [Thelotrema lepadinum]|nr:hypothetical protein [Thelotrema lepadinum]
MDATKIWRRDGPVPQLLNVRTMLHNVVIRADSVCRLVTLFLYMVAELSALQQIINALTGLDGLPALIVEALITAIYTGQNHTYNVGDNKMLIAIALGGFRISFITDNIQGAMVVALIILAVITVGVETRVDPALVSSSGLLGSSLLGWQLIYILPVAILTNDFFLSGFWMRTFASKTDRDLRIGVGIATGAVTVILLLVGLTGLLAAWTGAWSGDPSEGSIVFFLLLEQLPNWVVGIVLIMTVALSTAAFDSFVSAMVSTGSNDLFRNKLNLWLVRLAVLLTTIPVIVVALKSPSVINIYLISDLLSASSIPVLVIGLNDRFYWWKGFEVVVGGLGGLLTVFIFGTIYYGNAQDGANLLLLENGLYADDWSVFGAFVAAPIGGLIWAVAAMALRLATQWTLARIRGYRFGALDAPPFYTANEEHDIDQDNRNPVRQETLQKSGKFF